MGRRPESEPSSNDVSPGRVFRSLGGFLGLLSNLAEQGGRELAELPGVDANDIRFEVKQDVLTLSATRSDRKYRKEVLRPSAVRVQASTSSYRNGVLEIRLPKAR